MNGKDIRKLLNNPHVSSVRRHDDKKLGTIWHVDVDVTGCDDVNRLMSELCAKTRSLTEGTFVFRKRGAEGMHGI